MSPFNNDGATVGGSCAVDGVFVIVCFDGDRVVSTGLLVGLLEGGDDNFNVGKLVDMEPSNDVGAAVNVCYGECQRNRW